MKVRLAIIFLLISVGSYGQYYKIIRTGRPGQAIGAFTVGKHVLQLQQGLDYYSVADTKFPPKGFVSNNVIRYGILETVELSALIEYQSEKTKFDTNSISQSGLSNLHLGFRIHITDQKGWIPTTGFQMRLKMPEISKDFGARQLATVMVFVANWSLPKNMSIMSNWILSYNGNDSYPTGKYVLNFGFPIYNQLSGFIENYGQINRGVFQSRFDGGFAYLINNNVQLDLSTGYGHNQGIQDYFVSTGISWRIVGFRKNNKEYHHEN
ncbi:MAG: hypothetical protein RL596_1788 [Bacteroidota bacterium]